MKKIIFLFAPLCAMLMVGCVKDEPNAKFIKLYAEGLTPSSKSAKAAVAGNATYWVDGDRVRINSQVFKVLVADPASGVAVAEMEEGAAPTGPISAVYPAEIYKSNTGSTYTITVPDRYVYRETGIASGHKQILDGLPMVSYSSETAPESLVFSHLTAAITVRVKNTLDVDVDIYQIDLINDQYKLSGDIAVNFSGFVADANSVPRPVVSAAEKAGGDTVTLIFDEVKKTVPAGEYRDIQIPILPIGGGGTEGNPDSKFTVKIEARKTDNPGVRYLYSRVQGADGEHPAGVAKDNTILRAQLGYATSRFDATSTPPLDIFDKMSDGVHDGYYAINSADDFKELADALNKKWDNKDDNGYNHSNYYITADIDMNYDTIPPLHYYSENCTFDGGEHTISNVYIDSRKQNDEQENLCGLFTEPEGDSITIKGINIDNVEYIFGHKDLKVLEYDQYDQSCVGGIFGQVGQRVNEKGKTVKVKGTVIEDCHLTNVKMGAAGSITSVEATHDQVDEYFGGIVGLVCGDCEIRNCSLTNIDVDNENDYGSKKIIDQFGGAIGRIDVGNKGGEYTYQVAKDNCPIIKVKDFTYDQGDDYLVFHKDLKQIRYGGVVSSVTRGGKLYLENITVKHKVDVQRPTGNMSVGGLIGLYKATNKWALHVSGNIYVQGEAKNNGCVATYGKGQWQFNRYWCILGKGDDTAKYVYSSAKDIVVKLDGSDEYCNTPDNLFHLTSSGSGYTTEFYYPKQSFFKPNEGYITDQRPTPSTPSSKRR